MMNNHIQLEENVIKASVVSRAELLRKQQAMIIQELEGRKKLSGMKYYVPNKMQLVAHKSEARTILLCAGNRTGKSTYGAMELCWHLTRDYPDWYPQSKRFKHPIKAVVSATSFAIVGRVIEPKIRSLLPATYYKIKRTPQGYLQKILCKDGSQVDVLTLEMDDRMYESADWDFAWEDEPQHQRKREAIVRGLLDRNGLEVITFTPITEPWMKEELLDKVDGKNIAMFSSSTRDNMFDVQGNPILSEEGIKRFEQTLSEDVRESRIHGVFFTMRGLVYKEFGDHHILDFNYKKQGRGTYPVYCVLDPHDRQPHHLIWAFVDPDDDLYVDTEMIVHCELPELAKRIKEHERQMGYNMRMRIIDPNFGRKPARSGSNDSVIRELYKNGASFYEPCDDVELGHMTVREYLHYDMSKEVTAVNKPKLFFSRERTPKTIKSIRNLQYQEWTGKTKEDKNPKEVEKEKDNHGADTVRYLCIMRPKYASIHKEEEVDASPY